MLNRPELSPRGKAAVALARKGYFILPVAEGRKSPLLVRGGEDMCNASNDPEQVAAWWLEHPNANIAIVCNAASRLLVIDIDTPEHGEGHGDGRKTLADFEARYGRKLTETIKDVTPTGGIHLFYRVPEGMPMPKQSANSVAGVDVRTSGYAIVPPSIHPDTGTAYEWSCSPEDMEQPAEAGETEFAFLEYVNAIKAPAGAKAAGGLSGSAYTRRELPERIPKGSRNQTVFEYACSLRGRGLEYEQIKALVLDGVVPKCEGDDFTAEALALVKHVCDDYPKGYPDAMAAAVSGSEGEGKQKADKRAGLVIAFELLQIDANVKRAVKLNVLDNQLWVVVQAFPDMKPVLAPRRMIEADFTAIYRYLLIAYGGKQFSRDAFMQAIELYAATCDRFSPFIARIRQTPVKLIEDKPGYVLASFDGGKTWEIQLDLYGNLFNTYLGSSDDDPETKAYNSDMEKLLGRAIIGRAKGAEAHAAGDEGKAKRAKFDHVFTFIGEQGTGKSTFLERLMFDDANFFLSGLGSLEGTAEKDAMLSIAGKLLVIDDENQVFTGKNADKVKAFITKSTDEFRPPYGKGTVTMLRTAVFAATTNSRTLMNDPTGNRRFLPILCTRKAEQKAHPYMHPGASDGMPSATTFQQEIDKHVCVFWARALAEFERDEAAGFSNMQPSEAVYEHLNELRESVTAEDGVALDIAEWLECGWLEETITPETIITVRKAAFEALGYNAQAWEQVTGNGRALQKRITQVLDNYTGLERGKGIKWATCRSVNDATGEVSEIMPHQAKAWWTLSKIV